MKKSKIYVTILFGALFAGMFLVAQVSHPVILASGSASIPIEETQIITPNADGKPLGVNQTYIYDMDGYTITLDGYLDDWDGVPHAVFGGIDTYVGYDDTYVYVACKWVDASEDYKISHINKTDAENWTQINGADDMLTVGFSAGDDTDLWTWTRSIRTTGGLAYEHDGTDADGGTLPFLRNLDANGKPLYYNNSNPIPDPDAEAIGTLLVGWLEDTPTGSQTDVELAWYYNETETTYYVEFRRLLVTGNADDIDLDFSDTTDMNFYIGKANKQNSLSMDVVVTAKILHNDNEDATFTWEVVPAAVSDALVIRGTVYDDYDGWTLTVFLTGWAAPALVAVNTANGEWSYLFTYNSAKMPLGSRTITVTFTPLYEDTIIEQQSLVIQDLLPPEFLGIVDIGANFDTLVPNDTDYVTIIIGLRDNYATVNQMTATLYVSKDDGVPIPIPFSHYQPGSITYNANISLTYDPEANNNYTYFIEAWDTAFNKATSDYYWFYYGAIPTTTTPGFGIIAAIIGLAGASFIAYKKFKK